MQKVTLTCPFTGATFEALEYADGKISFRHALTGEEIHMNWNGTINRYNIVKSAFKYYPIVEFKDAAKILKVTPQRITQLARDEIIPVHDVNSKSVFLLDDVLKYKETRKVGAPRKVNNDGAGNN